MPDTAPAIQFTVLGPDGPPVEVADPRIADFYAYPDGLQACWVRGNMIASVDGGATADGKTGDLGAAGDRLVFDLMRHATDVILVGGATVRTENYSGAQVPVALRRARQGRGQSEVPPIAVITRSGNLDPDTLFFTRTEVPPLVFTCTESAGTARARLGEVADVIDASGPAPDEVDGDTVLKILSERRLYRVLSEGGPAILGLLIRAGLLDELCLTVAPFLVGGAAARIATGPGEVLTRMRPAHVLTDDDGYLYTRYVRSR
ncbi:pyrimidine reductase family protein [Mycobacterium sp. IDR2000157661]|uniref:pyrimidine reductase family protein n=1 Tax=Mycobacterium sp. IDR2000157661 TaxID=2867005 RepID=UPI001EEBD3DE|nr:pyrimidine reductase family protein [Mycobacterium sp. IDR2000157661]ULE32892.1 pyrimidine reductase family protein [Mycobacterium sp. IDR2000157661]